MFGRKKAPRGGNGKGKNKFKFPKLKFGKSGGEGSSPPREIGNPYNVTNVSEFGGSTLSVVSVSGGSELSFTSVSETSGSGRNEEVVYWKPGDDGKHSTGHYRHRGSGDIYTVVEKGGIKTSSSGERGFEPPPVKPKGPAVKEFLDSLGGGGSAGLQSKGLWRAPWMGSDGMIDVGGRKKYKTPTQTIAGIFGGDGGWVHVSGDPGGFGSRLGGNVGVPPRSVPLEFGESTETVAVGNNISSSLHSLFLSGDPVLTGDGPFRLPRASSENLLGWRPTPPPKPPKVSGWKPTPPPKPQKVSNCKPPIPPKPSNLSKKCGEKPPLPPKPILKKTRDAKTKHRRSGSGYDALLFEQHVCVYSEIVHPENDGRPSARELLRKSPGGTPVKNKDYEVTYARLK